MKKEEEIKDIFADLKTIVNTKEGKIVERPIVKEKPTKKSHTSIKLGLIILI